MPGMRMRSGSARIAHAGLLVLLLVPSGAVAGRRQNCAARGGTYFEDGTCEVGRDDRRKDCLRQGGRFLSNGTCEIHHDPIQDCKNAGGDLMHRGKCYHVVRPGERIR